MNTNTAFAPVPNQRGLYPVVPSLDWLVRMLHAGVTMVQLRIKNRSEEEAFLAADIKAAIMLGRRYNAQVFINDYWRLAIYHGAYGVHLGQEDMDRADPDAIRGAGLRLGLSTHDDTELERALSWKPSYIALGHIFPTSTKVMQSKPQGLDTLRRLISVLPPSIPTVAIGGISREQVKAVLACGVSKIAVVSAITLSPYWRHATKNLLSIIAEWEGNL